MTDLRSIVVSHLHFDFLSTTHKGRKGWQCLLQWWIFCWSSHCRRWFLGWVVAAVSRAPRYRSPTGRTWTPSTPPPAPWSGGAQFKTEKVQRIIWSLSCLTHIILQWLLRCTCRIWTSQRDLSRIKIWISSFNWFCSLYLWGQVQSSLRGDGLHRTVQCLHLWPPHLRMQVGSISLQIFFLIVIIGFSIAFVRPQLSSSVGGFRKAWPQGRTVHWQKLIELKVFQF